MDFSKMNSEERIANLIKPIIQVLQESGGQLTRSEIKQRICELDDDIAIYASLITTSKKTGKDYSNLNSNSTLR